MKEVLALVDAAMNLLSVVVAFWMLFAVWKIRYELTSLGIAVHCGGAAGWLFLASR